MIQQTFLHLPGVGINTERKLSRLDTAIGIHCTMRLAAVPALVSCSPASNSAGCSMSMNPRLIDAQLLGSIASTNLAGRLANSVTNSSSIEAE